MGIYIKGKYIKRWKDPHDVYRLYFLYRTIQEIKFYEYLESLPKENE